MSDAPLQCSKCGKPYLRGGKRFQAHVDACNGTPFVAKGPSGSRRKPQAVEPETLSGIAGVMADANNRKQELIRHRELVKTQLGMIDGEIEAIDRSINLLKQARRD